MQPSSDSEDFERELRGSLYRFDCPDPHSLGEYALDLLSPADRTRTAAHAAECDDCRAELQTLRVFLATPTSVAEPLLERARRIVATLFVPRPGLAYGGLRGAADASARVFEAADADVTVSVAPGQATGSLIGLVVSSTTLTDHEVRAVPRDGGPIMARIDDLGNFSIQGATAGLYALEIDLDDGVLVIEELRVD
jgi:hypothetical protein